MNCACWRVWPRRVAGHKSSPNDPALVIAIAHCAGLLHGLRLRLTPLIEPSKVLDLAREPRVNVATLQANFKAAFGTTVLGYAENTEI